MAVQLSRSHGLDKAATRGMVEAIATSLSQQLSFRYHWEGDRLVFKRTGVSGHIEVEERHVHVVVKKSPMLPVSEAWIREQVEAVMNRYLD